VKPKRVSKKRQSAMRKARAVEAWIATNGNITKTCRIVGINPTTFYVWRREDEIFSTQLIEAEQELHDRVKSKLIKIIDDTDDLGAIKFYLKHRHPEYKNSGDKIHTTNVLNLIQTQKNKYGL